MIALRYQVVSDRKRDIGGSLVQDLRRRPVASPSVRFMRKTDAMVEIGYSLSSEEHGPQELIETARQAEEAGFAFAILSDHFHPWIDARGQSPFAWTVLGGIATQTSRLRVGTGVTCPTMRYHPALVAQMAATTATLFGDRFFLGVGTGENLNERRLTAGAAAAAALRGARLAGHARPAGRARSLRTRRRADPLLHQRVRRCRIQPRRNPPDRRRGRLHPLLR
jgi:hypothetical protein